LFYSKDCKHCSEIMKDLEEKKVTVTHLTVAEYAGFLKNMGIEHVPTLMVNDPYQKIFLTGKDAIRQYLSACAESKKAQGKAARKTPLPQRGREAVPLRGTGMVIDISIPALSLRAKRRPEDGCARKRKSASNSAACVPQMSSERTRPWQKIAAFRKNFAPTAPSRSGDSSAAWTAWSRSRQRFHRDRL
jgi:hypothetical protein